MTATPQSALLSPLQTARELAAEFAKVDSSIAHVFGFHHLMLATVRLFSRPEQWQPNYSK